MKPGDYTWAPEQGGGGPLVVLVSLPEQRAYVYQGGRLIAVSTCSTGRDGHRTPTGVFAVLQKDKDHVSSTYKGAQMPYMERLTWSGIALHAGNLPGYPASHGCIRLPYDFSQLLFGVTHLGVAVILADEHSQPRDVVHPGLLLSVYAEEEARQVVAKASKKALPPQHRNEAPHRPAKVLVSVVDKKVIVFEDGHERVEGPLFLKDPTRRVGNHVFVLKAANGTSGAFVWTSASYRGDAHPRLEPADAGVLDRITTNRETAEAIHALMHPGFLMVVTDEAAPVETRSPRSFVIATHHDPSGWETRVIRN